VRRERETSAHPLVLLSPINGENWSIIASLARFNFPARHSEFPRFSTGLFVVRIFAFSIFRFANSSDEGSRNHSCTYCDDRGRSPTRSFPLRYLRRRTVLPLILVRLRVCLFARNAQRPLWHASSAIHAQGDAKIHSTCRARCVSGYD
jgi:hypothetical protein